MYNKGVIKKLYLPFRVKRLLLKIYYEFASFVFFTPCGVLMDKIWQPEILKSINPVYLSELEFSFKGCALVSPLICQQLNRQFVE